MKITIDIDIDGYKKKIKSFKKKVKKNIKGIYFWVMIIELFISFTLAMSIISDNMYGDLYINEKGFCTSVENRTICFGAICYKTIIQVDDFWVNKNIEFIAYLKDGVYWPSSFKEL